MVNRYGKFIRILADLSSPFNNLLKKDVQWNWSAECQESFAKIKETLTLTEVLAHFNPNVPFGFACDTSGVGIGAVIYHKYEDGSERPIAYPKPSQMQTETTPKLREKHSVLSLASKSFISSCMEGHSHS